MKTVIILNGPPGVGKDTIADALPVDFKVSFKQPMFDIARSILGPKKYHAFEKFYDCRETKEQPLMILGGMSCREFMIWISECVIKPAFGKDYFGVRLAETVNGALAKTAVCSDGGFSSEIPPLLSAGIRVALVRLHRHGFTFDGDSRSYIDDNSLRGHALFTEHDIWLNYGDIDGAVNQIMSRCCQIVKNPNSTMS